MPDSPYSIITISAICLLFYSVSLAFVRFGIISADWQRKIWNTLLLIAITVAGSLGLLLAVTVNFKINLPLTDSLLVWHVDFGIALFIISGFHFSWHIKYYVSLFSKTAKTIDATSATPANPQKGAPVYKLGFNLNRLPFSLGFTAMATQLILLREFLSVFNGNELVIGIMLANWMLLTGFGALMNRKTKNHAGLKGMMIGLFTLAIIPVITLFLLNWLRNIVLPTGGMPGLGQIIFGTSFLLAPFCLLSGWLFSAVSHYLSHALNQNAISHTYGWETLGSIAAGILCSLVLVFVFESFQNLAIILIINSLILFLISRKEIFGVRKKFHLYLAAALIIAFATLVSNLDKTATQYLFPDQEIVSFKDTPYGKLVVTEKAGQLNFFENNTLLFTTNNITTNEETVHYALLQRPLNGNVLLVGGGISGVAEEILKYPLKRLDCVEINPRIQAIGKSFHRLPTDKRFKMHFGDPRLVVNKMSKQKEGLRKQSQPLIAKIDSLSFDAIILNLPEPSTLQINRLYTFEFLLRAKKLLAEEGIVALSLLPTFDYVGSDALKIQSTMYQTLKAVFKNVLVIPGEKNYFLASDGALTSEVSMLGKSRGISNEYVNEYYMDDVSLKERSDKIMKRISVEAPINRDFEPVACYRQFNYWLSYAGNSSAYLLLIPVILLLAIAAIRSDGITLALFPAGFSSFSVEIILMLTFQVLYGYIYLVTGVFITLFMAGLATGVFMSKHFHKNTNYNTLVKLQFISIILIVLSLAGIYFFSNFQLSSILLHFLFGLLILGISITTGAQFHIASVLKSGDVNRVAATNYSADLIGSAAGALLINAWIVPAFGLINSLWILTVCGVSAVILMLLKKRKGV